MAEFSVKTNAVRTTVDAEEELKRELENIQQSIRKISGSLAIKTTAAPSLKRRLGKVAGRVVVHRESMGNMKNALEESMGLYEKTEQNICGYTGGEIKTEANEVVSGSSFWDRLMNQIGKAVGKIGAIVGGIISSITTVWSNLAAFFEGTIGNGDVTNEQPTAGWATEGVITGGVADGTAGAATTSGATNAVDSGIVVADSKVDYKNSVGQQIVHVVDENGNFRPPYSKYSAPGGYTFGNETDKMQCVGYAWGRMEELTGRPVNFSCGTASNIVNTYQGNSALELVNDIGNIKPPALAVVNPGGYFGRGPMRDTGHVVVVEAVYPKENGTYDIYFSEGNCGRNKDGTPIKDGTLSMVNSSQIAGCTGYVQYK